MKAAIAGMVLLLGPTLAAAGEFRPSARWLDSIRPDAPVIGYKLGLITLEGHGSVALGTPDGAYLGDLRAALRESGLFDNKAARRVAIHVTVKHGECKATEAESIARCELAVAYRFLDGGRAIYEQNVRVIAAVDQSGYTSAPYAPGAAANLKVLLLNLRKSVGDDEFLARVPALEKDINRDLASGRSFSGVMSAGFVGFVEGSIAAVGTLGEVAGLMVEAAASPEFQATLQQEMAAQQAEQPRQDAAMQQTQRTAAAPAARTGGSTSAPALPAATKPLRMVLSISMTNLPGDRNNPSCYSSIISRPGPPGWGTRDASLAEVRPLVESYKTRFFDKCRAASGREITSAGNYNFHANQYNEDRPRAKVREDVTVTMP